jgi:hypothetical protein
MEQYHEVEDQQSDSSHAQSTVKDATHTSNNPQSIKIATLNPLNRSQIRAQKEEVENQGNGLGEEHNCEDGEDTGDGNTERDDASDGFVRDYKPRRGDNKYSAKIPSIKDYEEMLAKDRAGQAAKRGAQKEDPASAFPTTPEAERECIKELYDAFWE